MLAAFIEFRRPAPPPSYPRSNILPTYPTITFFVLLASDSKVRSDLRRMDAQISFMAGAVPGSET